MPPTGAGMRTTRSCCSTDIPVRSRRISSSTARSCGRRRASSVWTSAVMASPTTRRRPSACARSRTSRAPWPGSDREASAPSPSSGPRWVGSRPSHRSRSSGTAHWTTSRGPMSRSAPGRPARPRIVAVVADSVATSAVVPVASQASGPRHHRARRSPVRRCGTAAGCGPARDTDPIKVIALVDPVPVLLIHGEADTTVPIADGRRLAAAAGPCGRALGGRRRRPQPGARDGRTGAYEARVTTFLRDAFAGGRTGCPYNRHRARTSTQIDPDPATLP